MSAIKSSRPRYPDRPDRSIYPLLIGRPRSSTDLTSKASRTRKSSPGRMARARPTHFGLMSVPITWAVASKIRCKSTTGVGSFKTGKSSKEGPTPVPVRVSPTDRIRHHIDELFASDRPLPEILEEVARLGAQLLMQAA